MSQYSKVSTVILHGLFSIFLVCHGWLQSLFKARTWSSHTAIVSYFSPCFPKKIIKERVKFSNTQALVQLCIYIGTFGAFVWKPGCTLTFSHEENGLIFSNLGKMSTLKSKQLSHIMKAETLAVFIFLAVFGYLRGPRARSRQRVWRSRERTLCCWFGENFCLPQMSLGNT